MASGGRIAAPMDGRDTTSPFSERRALEAHRIHIRGPLIVCVPWQKTRVQLYELYSAVHRQSEVVRVGMRQCGQGFEL